MNIVNWISTAASLVRSIFKAGASDTTAHEEGQGTDLQWKPSSYGDVYAASPNIFMALELRKNAIRRINITASRPADGRSSTPLPTSHPLSRFLAMPNPHMTQADLFGVSEISLGLWGQAAWAIEYEGATPQLWPLQVNKLRTLWSKPNWIRGYRYEGAERDVYYDADQVMLFQYWNPTDQRAPLSPIAPLLLTIKTDIDATIANRRIFTDGARPDMVFYTSETRNAAQVKEFYDAWDQRHQGVNKSRRPALAAGYDKIERLSLTQQEMDYIQGLKWGKEQVAGVYGVPLPLMGDLEHASMANLEGLERAFWRLTMLAQAEWYRDRINTLLLPRLGWGSLQASLDTSEVSVLTEEEAPRLAREKLYLEQGVMSVNEVRRSRHMTDIPGGDVYEKRPLPFRDPDETPQRSLRDQSMAALIAPAESTGIRNQ